MRHETEFFEGLVRKAGYGLPGERILVVGCSPSSCAPDKFRQGLEGYLSGPL